MIVHLCKEKKQNALPHYSFAGKGPVCRQRNVCRLEPQRVYMPVSEREHELREAHRSTTARYSSHSLREGRACPLANRSVVELFLGIFALQKKWRYEQVYVSGQRPLLCEAVVTCGVS